MKNTEIRLALFTNNIKYNKVADYLGIADATLSRWLRKDLTPEKKAQIMEAIESLAKEVN